MVLLSSCMGMCIIHSEERRPNRPAGPSSYDGHRVIVRVKGGRAKRTIRRGHMHGGEGSQARGGWNSERTWYAFSAWDRSALSLDVSARTMLSSCPWSPVGAPLPPLRRIRSGCTAEENSASGKELRSPGRPWRGTPAPKWTAGRPAAGAAMDSSHARSRAGILIASSCLACSPLNTSGATFKSIGPASSENPTWIAAFHHMIAGCPKWVSGWRERGGDVAVTQLLRVVFFFPSSDHCLAHRQPRACDSFW